MQDAVDDFEAAGGGLVVAGAEGLGGLDADRGEAGGRVAAAVAAVDVKAAGGDGLQAFERAFDPVDRGIEGGGGEGDVGAEDFAGEGADGREIGVFGGDLDDPVVVVGVLVGGGGEGEVFALAHGIDEAIGLVPGQGGGELGQRHAARLQRRDKGSQRRVSSRVPLPARGRESTSPLCSQRRLAPAALVPECSRLSHRPNPSLVPDQASRVAAQSRSGRGYGRDWAQGDFGLRVPRHGEPAQGVAGGAAGGDGVFPVVLRDRADHHFPRLARGADRGDEDRPAAGAFLARHLCRRRHGAWVLCADPAAAAGGDCDRLCDAAADRGVRRVFPQGDGAALPVVGGVRGDDRGCDHRLAAADGVRGRRDQRADAWRSRLARLMRVRRLCDDACAEARRHRAVGDDRPLFLDHLLDRGAR